MGMQIIALQTQQIKVDGITLEKKEDGTLKLNDTYKALILLSATK